MDFLVSNIVFDTDGALFDLPTEVFVSWQNGCDTGEEAIDFVSDLHGFAILSCDCIEE